MEQTVIFALVQSYTDCLFNEVGSSIGVGMRAPLHIPYTSALQQIFINLHNNHQLQTFQILVK